MNRISTSVGTFVGAAVIAVTCLIALSALEALPVKWLWNGICVPLFKLPAVTFLQAWGLAILSRILFKSTK